MSRYSMTGETVRVLAFVQGLMPLPASVGMTALGQELDGELVAGVIYEGFNGANVWMHVAAKPGARWLTKSFLRYCFVYPFDELGVRRVSSFIDASNAESIALCSGLGFCREAVLREAAPGGEDCFIYSLRRADCRYLEVTP